jgi:hypothetical protein
MPTATDLVTDLPADFEVFGQAVDTRLKALQPGTTLGDLAYSSATANTNTRLAIGTTGQVLTVSGGVPAWGNTSSGALTFIAGGSASATTSLTVSNCFSSTYRNYRIMISNLIGSGSEVETFLRMSSSGTPNTAATYTFQTFRLYGTGTLASTGNNGTSSGSYIFAATTTPANQGGSCVIDICSPFQALPTTFTTQSIVYNNAIGAYMTNQGGGAHNTSSSFDGFNISTATTTLSYDYRIYGYANS